MTRTVLPRPTLLPGLARLWRDRHTVQLGLDPHRAVLLEVADPVAARLLDLLDGSRSEREIIERAEQLRVSRDDVHAVIDVLRAAGLVVGGHTLLPGQLPEPARRRLTAEAVALALRPDPAPSPAQVLRRRAAARVVLTGRGRLAAPLAVALAQSGIGHVSPALGGDVTPDEAGGALSADDVRRPRSAAVADAITRTAPEVRTGPVRGGPADLVLQIGTDRPAGLLAAGYARRRQAHLVLAVRDGTAVVGPLVPPAGTPCLNCLDLHRRDRDPAWSVLAAQLADERRPEPCTVPTLLAAVGYATSEVLAFLDGANPETVGGAVEITAPGRHRRRAWPPHPDCDCARMRRRSQPAGPPAAARRPGIPAGPTDTPAPAVADQNVPVIEAASGCRRRADRDVSLTGAAPESPGSARVLRP